MFKTNLGWNITLFLLLWCMGAFLFQHEASKIKNTIVRNSFSAVVYRACNLTHTIEKPIAVLSVSSENFFPLVLCNMPKHKILNVKKSDDPNNYWEKDKLKWLLWLKTPIIFFFFLLFNVFVVLFVSCYICVSYLPLTLIGYNWAMNKILNSNSTWKSTIDCVLLRLYSFLPKTALPTAQSSFTKSNYGTITAHHDAFAREKSLISLTSV